MVKYFIDIFGVDLSYKLSISLLSFFFMNELYHFVKEHYFCARHDVSESFVGCVHALIATCYGAYSLFIYDPLIYVETYDYYTTNYPYSQTAFAISYGFFLWHFYIYSCCDYFDRIQWDLIIHALLCLWTYSVVMFTPYFHRTATIALFYEFSTLFLNSVDIFRFYKMNKLKLYFKMIFAVAFFYCRLVIGAILLKELYSIFITESIEIKNKDHIPLYASFSAFALILLFYVLNLYWMTLIIQRVCSIVIPSNDSQSQSIPTKERTPSVESQRFENEK